MASRTACREAITVSSRADPMFERFEERARRVIFFARYEASQYGSPYIESEHLLLGLAREDPFLRSRIGQEQLRSEIEKHVTRAERISVAMEVPLSAECKQILVLAGEEADRLGSRAVGTEHLLLALLRVEESLAGKILREKKFSRELVLEKLPESRPGAQAAMHSSRAAVDALQNFLTGLRDKHPEQPASYFAESGQFIDTNGRRWVGREEIEKGFAGLFGPYAKRRTSFQIEDTTQPSGEQFIATLLWRDAVSSGDPKPTMLRMSVVMALGAEYWTIVLAQATFVNLR
ncbi:MAG TPA: Clp protease N-terminal domain-containing protein [Candidatus Acidoferrum sp.]|nr:Clp protease N-terminal domain-containing protein [Candidatus Acidoferrum sp.]